MRKFTASDDLKPNPITIPFKEVSVKRLISMMAAGAVILAFLSPVSCMKEKGRMSKEEMKSMVSAPEFDLKTAMRKLWEDHVTWTRNFIVSSLAGLDDAGKVAERLLRNQDDIGNAVKPYYGEEAGNKLSALLRDHILIAADVVKAAKSGNQKNLEMKSQTWTANADTLASFLSTANPNWTKAGLEDMLHKHLEYTTGEVVARLKKNWSADIESYDRGHEHMLMFADLLADGIIKQFPEKFKP